MSGAAARGSSKAPVEEDPSAAGVESVRIGISACLLGERVRYDGQHKLDAYLRDTVGSFVELVPVCPEVEAGLGTPREPMRLVRAAGAGAGRSARGGGGDGTDEPADAGPGAVRLVGTRSFTDHTARMERYSRSRARELERLDLSGFIFKKGSPSCGLRGVKVWSEKGAPERKGRGLFAAALAARLPLLPLEEEGRLRDPRRRENFFERVFAYRRVTRCFAGRWRRAGIVRFHTREKLLLLAHDPRICRELGRFVASAGDLPRAELAARYPELYLRALSRIATARKHGNVLQHALGHFKRTDDPQGRRDLEAAIEEYRRGLVPLIVPVTLLRHLAARHSIEPLAGQVYLDPHRRELMVTARRGSGSTPRRAAPPRGFVWG